MLGLGLRAARPLASPHQFFCASWSTRSLLHFAATPRLSLGLQSCHSPCYSRQLKPQILSHIAHLQQTRLATTVTPTPPVQTITLINKAEAEADARPNDVDAQLQLFRLLDYGKSPGWKVIISRWERMCEFNPSSPLLRSDEAFKLYLSALVKSGMTSSVHFAVQRRDKLLSTLQEIPASKSSSTQPAESTSTESVPPATPQTRSQEIASEVLTGDLSSSSLPPDTSRNLFSRASSSSATPAALMAGGGGGDPRNPIYVTIAEPRGEFWRKIIRNIAFFALIGFVILVGLAIVLDNTSVLKAGPRAAEFEPMQGKIVKFSDVHGVDEVKEELQEVVEFLKDPTTFTTLGGKLPKGILLTGPPGTGKTMLARAVAGEAGVPFLFASGSEFEEIFVGVGAKRVRELFATARKKQPAIIFIDELDAIGGKRSNRDQQHLKQTLNQLLVEMDGFLQSEGVVVIAATNFPESLDQALVRPGRFDRIISVPLPDVRGRVQILQHHMRNVITSPEVDPMILARGTPGFSGADLQNMVNQAAIQASKEGAKEVNLKHFEWAKDRIIMGAERRTHYIDPKVKKLTAYHEGGHALVAMFTEGAMPLHKVTCVTRGHALGLTQQLPEDDRVSVSKKEYQASIDVSMGGRAAEELIYGPENVTSGAVSDIRQATNVASAMVRHFGYSNKVGPVFYHENDSTISPSKREEIEAEIQRLVEEGQARARNLLKAKEDELHRLATALVEYETLDLQEVQKVIKGEPIRPVEEKLLEASQAEEQIAAEAEAERHGEENSAAVE